MQGLGAIGLIAQYHEGASGRGGVMLGEPRADFIERIYDAVVEPRLWSGVLEGFADLMRGWEANLIDQDELRCEGQGISVRGDPAALPLYLSQFIKRSPYLKTTDLPLTLRVLTDEDKLPKSDLIRTEYYNDFLKRFDVHSFLWVRLALAPGRSTVMTVTRPAHREPFGGADIALAECLQPHLVRAWRLAAEISQKERWRDGAAMLLDDSPGAAFFVGEGNAVRHRNSAADTALAKAGPLVARNGVLRASTPEATRKLHDLIAAARDPDPHRRRGGIISLPREGHAPLVISIVPIRRESEILLFGKSSEQVALVCVRDTEHNGAITEQRLRDAFALTRTEAKIAAELIAGHEPRKAAEHLGISYYTVRGHLVRMFDKTGVRRQADLVRLLIRALDQLPQ